MPKSFPCQAVMVWQGLFLEADSRQQVQLALLSQSRRLNLNQLDLPLFD
jgi:hypothetical protein